LYIRDPLQDVRVLQQLLNSVLLFQSVPTDPTSTHSPSPFPFLLMSYLYKHSALSSLILYCRTGSLSFVRYRGKDISPSSSSTDDVNEAPLDIDGKITANHLVTWDGPNDPSNPINWPFWQKVVITATLRYATWLDAHSQVTDKKTVLGPLLYTSVRPSIRPARRM